MHGTITWRQRLSQMQTQPSKLYRPMRERKGNAKDLMRSVRTSITERERSSPFLVCQDFVPMNLRNEKEAVDVAFQALIADANEEFAMLLREMGTALGSASLSVQNRSVSELLMRAVRCAAKQYMLQTELGSLAITDELTGLCNRRGFVAIADRQLKLAHRCGKGMLLFFADVNGLKQINDSFGHCEGNRALKRTAEALMKTFRDSDVIARMGGDEFAVLEIEASGQGEATIRERLRRYP